MSESNQNRISDSELGDSFVGKVLPRMRDFGTPFEKVRLQFKKSPSDVSLFSSRAVKDRRVNNVYFDNVSLMTVTFNDLVSLEDAKSALVEIGYSGKTEVV